MSRSDVCSWAPAVAPLALGDVHAVGKRAMPATDWARGARIEPGELLR